MSEQDEAKQEINLLDSSPSTTPSTATISKLSTYRYNTRSSAAASSSSRSNSVFSDSAIDAQLKYLLGREAELQLQIKELSEEIAQLQAKITNQNQDNSATPNICWEEFEAPEWCVPIKADVLTFEWDVFAKECQFDVILMDPPWQLATHAPTRGVAIAYQQLPDICIEELPIPKLQKNGFLFIWVINNKYSKAFDLMRKWGYTYCDDITWVKQTVNRRMAKGHGFYLQHAKETCLMGRKDPPGCKHSISSDVIFSERRGQSQKPEELYEMIEELVPNGNYLEIFGRKNNLRDYWVTIGNEL
ncbi:MT-A70-domain-containing protein [Gigaspora rosea]|uniref:mRNA m(6)A methyltransferase n=1 Tax=Gigaspora rosea TaxID=44941 RepID=A0A397UJE3_9GLOM|nr:MT-A70-domain-containing protein [Gigaspora rosea]